MSNYQARKRATRAERAAEECRRLVHEMERACNRRMRDYEMECRERFRLEHLSMEAQMRSVMDAAVAIQKAYVPGFIAVPNEGKDK